MIKKFLIVAYPYTDKSAGIRCLHELCDALVRIGYEAHLIFLDGKTGQAKYTQQSNYFSPNLIRSKITHSEPQAYIYDVIKNGIVIYPEIVVGNPLQATNVVRYFLNEDGFLTGRKSNFSPTDFCLAFFDRFFQNSDAVLNKPFIHEAFHSKDTLPWSGRPIDVTYVGKASAYRECFRINGTFEITRQYPSAKEELALLLRNTRYFYSWDNISATNTDAIMCGAKVVLMHDAPWTRDFLMTWDSEFGRVPFLRGHLQGSSVIIENRPDYDDLAAKYIQNIHNALAAWPSAVKDTTEKIFKYFESRS